MKNLNNDCIYDIFMKIDNKKDIENFALCNRHNYSIFENYNIQKYYNNIKIKLYIIHVQFMNKYYAKLFDFDENIYSDENNPICRSIIYRNISYNEMKKYMSIAFPGIVYIFYNTDLEFLKTIEQNKIISKENMENITNNYSKLVHFSS